MTDIATAWAAIQARAASQITGMPILWPDEGNELPVEPAPFVFIEMTTDRGAFIEIGGGRGSNTFRNRGELLAYVFVPIGEGLARALALAEPVAAAFRSYQGGGVTFDGATVQPLGEGASLVPPGLTSAAGNYSAAMVVCPLHFDQIG
ncbi:MAG: hypothetical protein AB7F22_10620 [Reyranella sp.]|uniref:hypothetical protein n=1 Tax=Reyranella sp. TaxID=1929291 RepID=UPI003D149D82